MYDVMVTASYLVTTHSNIKKTGIAQGVTMCLAATLCPQISLQHGGYVTPFDQWEFYLCAGCFSENFDFRLNILALLYFFSHLKYRNKTADGKDILRKLG